LNGSGHGAHVKKGYCAIFQVALSDIAYDDVQGTGLRIVSFLPSATEIVYALGLGSELVGVSHECDFPPDANGKTKMLEA